MIGRRTAGAVFQDTGGATAIEFAILSTAFFAMLFGSVYASFLGFTNLSLHSAVEAAARCRSMGIVCTSNVTTQNYAASKFRNIGGGQATFLADTQTCGNRVRATMNYRLEWILGHSTIPLSATACFP